MADGKKVLAKVAQPQLQQGETLLGGCRSSGKGGVVKGVAVAGAGGAAGGAIGGAMSSGHGSGESIAAGVPQDRIFWIGVSERRLLYFGVSAFSSKPKKFVGQTPLELIASVEVKGQMATRRLTLNFVDGSSASVDLYRTSSPDSLQSALAAVLPGKVDG